MSFLESYRLELEAIGPIHVGTGESFPAYSYLVDEANREVLVLDAGRLLECLSEAQQQNYLEAVSQGPKQAQQTLRSLWASGHLDPTPATLRRVAASQAFINTVKNATDAAGLEFRPLPRSSEGAYLPGSSIKGALRTAWMFKRILNQGQDIEYSGRWAWGAKVPRDEWPLIHPPRSISAQVAQDFEALVLDYSVTDQKGRPQRNLHRDPFRQLRVGDSEPSEKLLLNRIGVFHPKASMDGPVLLAETFRTQTRLSATLRLHTALAQQRHKDTVSHALSARDLARACREYYLEVLHVEREYALRHGLEQTLKVYDALEQRLEANEHLFPLRIGFGSGRIAIRLALLLDGEEGKEPKTRKTAGHSKPKDGFPLGWAIARLEPY